MRQGEEAGSVSSGQQPAPNQSLQLPTNPITPNMASAAAAATAAMYANQAVTFNVGNFKGGILQSGDFKRELRKMGPINGMEL